MPSTLEVGGRLRGDEPLGSFVEDVVEYVTEVVGCPECSNATEIVGSQSAEFPDDSLYIEVGHRCVKCETFHLTSLAFGDLAEAHRYQVVMERRQSPDFRSESPSAKVH